MICSATPGSVTKVQAAMSRMLALAARKSEPLTVQVLAEVICMRHMCTIRCLSVDVVARARTASAMDASRPCALLM